MIQASGEYGVPRIWHMKRQADSIQAMTGAIVKASELQLVMPIIKEGGDILPVLSK